MALTTITTRLLRDLAVTTAKLAANAVTLAKLGSLTAKGGLITHDGTDHKALAVGSNGQVLTANSAAAEGVEWAEPSAGDVSAADFVYGETPTGTIDGANANFTLASTPEAGTVRVYFNGSRLNVGGSNDYTISGSTITFLTGTIPVAGDVVLVDYLK